MRCCPSVRYLTRVHSRRSGIGGVIDSGWPMGRLILSVMVLIGKASVSRDSNADLTYVVYISENWSSDMVFCFLLGESDGEMTRLRVSTDMAMVGRGVR